MYILKAVAAVDLGLINTSLITNTGVGKQITHCYGFLLGYMEERGIKF